jgi:calpain-15
VDEIIAKGEPWTDPDFPPEFGSICQDGCSNSQFSKSKQYEWKRMSELSDEPCIFKDGVQPGDIKQGGLGDCYYLCTLASMAEEESRIMDRFITKEVNAAGIYLMTLYINGEETPVIVDDWLPSQYN